MAKAKRLDPVQRDYLEGLARNTELIKRQVMMEVIQVACQCETYDQFRKMLYGMALSYLGDFEKMGAVPKGTTAEAAGKDLFSIDKKED